MAVSEYVEDFSLEFTFFLMSLLPLFIRTMKASHHSHQNYLLHTKPNFFLSVMSHDTAKWINYWKQVQFELSESIFTLQN